MSYQGITLLLGVVIGVGFAAYQYYTQRNTDQFQGSQNRCHTYTYVPPPEAPTENSKARSRRSSSRSSSTAEKCTICYEILSTDFKTLSCKHSFHMLCIKEWLKESRTCPVCRSSL